MISAAIFDMDGLMFDTEALWARYWEVSLSEFGYGFTRRFMTDSLGINKVRQLEVLREHYGDDMPAEEVFDRCEGLVDDHISREVPKKPGLDELLAWLRDPGVPMALASSSPMHEIEACLSSTGTRRFFDTIVSGAEVGRSKPAPDVFLAAAERLGVEPATSLVLEDSVAGVQAGAAGGFVTVMVPDLAQPTDQIRSLAHACCADLNEVVSLLESGRL